MTSGSVSNLGRRSLGDHAARFQAVDPVADAHDHGHVVLDHEHRGAQLFLDGQQQRGESLDLSLGHAPGRLVEAEHPRLQRQEAAELHDPAGAGGQLGGEAVGVGAESEEVGDVLGAGPAGPGRGGTRWAGGRPRR